MLVGRSLDSELRSTSPRISFQPDPGATHISQGTFVVDDDPTTSPPAPALEAVDQAVGQQLADELKAFVGSSDVGGRLDRSI